MANKFLNVLSDKVVINKNKLTVNTSELDLTPNTTYDVTFPTGIIKDLNNNNFRSIDLFKMSTGESSTGETGSTGETSPIITPTITTLPSGRKIYRHESDEASVLVFDMYGTEVRLLIPDCKYRTSNLKWGTYNTDTNVPNFYDTKYKDAYQNINRTEYIDGRSRDINVNDPIPVVTDTQLQELWPYFSTDLSAKELCDIWITYQDTITSACNPVFTGVPAIQYTRNLTIPHITGTFDVPNIYELMVIYLEQEAIDDLDKYKSDSEYQNYLLAHNSNNVRWFNNSWIWSATEATYRDIWGIRAQGISADLSKCYSYGVVPVRELSLGETGYTSETGSTGSTGGTAPTIILPGATLLPSGRQIYRHESDEASVLVFDRYGTEVHLLIPDCKYRSNLKWGTYNVEATAPNFYDIYRNDANRNINYTNYIDGRSRDINVSDPVPVLTDRELQYIWPDFSTDLSAKELCDIWITYQDTVDTYNNITGVPAVEYTRNLTIPGITGTFDIPNIYELMVIFLEQDAIDNLDKYKSVSEYQNYLLANNSNNVRWFNNDFNVNRRSIVSATESTYREIWCVTAVGIVDIDYKSAQLGIVPVQELSF